MIPTPQRDGTGRPVIPGSFEINRDQLLLAFQYMADYLREKGVNLTIYVAGGAVNTIYLRSRHSTGDVDFFGSNEQSRLLKDASKYAQQQSKSQLGANWFNNSMSLFLNRALEQDLMGASHHQNAILFSKPGLTVYAVPWEYALCGKTDRLTKPNKRPYDAADAVAYLHQCVKANGERAIQAQQIETWARKYNKAVSVLVLMEIDTLYTSKHGKHGISF
ncbi:Protein of unknown function DUF2204 [Penicillium italicum]|uniref:DUF7582 domain-containing protein n=1 Tax=Penicillium italicum TaxID=40296 RepID=A0A0A2KMC1_PENIT|nr:Protein of unknown function DUF2204 [Penicillium italicum]